MKRFIRGFVVLALAAGLVSLAAPAEAVKLRIGAHRAIMGSFEVVAHRMGYWKQEGLDYSFTYFKQGKLMRNAIIQGNLDTGTTGFSPYTTAISKGARVMAIGVTANICGTTAIVVPVKSKIKSVRELKGKVFANKKGTSTNFAFSSYVLPRYGLSPKDIKFLSVNTTETIAAIASGNAAGGMAADPKGEIAVQKGLVRRLENLCAYDKTRMMHIGNPGTLKNHPELYVKYFRGWLKAHRLLKNDPEKYAKVYTDSLVEVGDKTSLKIMRPVVKRLKSEVFIQDEVRTYLNDMADKQKKLGWIKKHPDFTKSKWLDDSILRKVAREMNYTN